MPQYLTSRLNSYLKVLTYFLFFILSSHLGAQTIFQTLEKSSQISKSSYPKLLEKFSNKNFEVRNIKDVDKVVLHPAFMNTILFYNKGNVLNLGIRDRCSLIDLISTDLLYSPNGKLENVLIQFTNKKEKIEIHVLKKKRFLQVIGYKQCPKSKELKKHFSPRNLRTTLKSERIKIPNSARQCKQFRESFLNNVKAPYLCDVANKIEKLKVRKVQLKNLSKSNYRKYQAIKKEIEISTSYKKILNKNSLLYLNRFCEHSSLGDQFCDDVFKINYWTNSVKKIKDDSAIKYYCRSYFKKTKLSKDQLKRCAGLFAENKRACEFLGTAKNELFPKPYCDELSITLNNSRLYQSYSDCPARVGSDSLTTAGRVLNHINATSLKVTANNCQANSTHSYAKFNKDFVESLYWQVQLCYDDKIRRKRVCYPTILNDVPNSELSLSANMGKILNRLKGFKNKESRICKTINEEDYRPTLLEYKTGCFILKNEKECFGTHCKFKVLFDDLEFKNYDFESKLSFDLLPFRYTEENKAFLKLIERHKKKRLKDIVNISSFKRIFDKHPNSIFFGIGCAQDILPTYFKAQSVNHCNILPFIVDGIIEDNGRYSLVTRTSFDHIHSPRLIPWTYIYSSIKNYQTHHPLSKWSFYAIY